MSRLLLIITALMLIACSDSVNKNFKKSNDQQISTMITEGKTTKQEVKATFGEPTSVDFNKDNREEWIYAYSEASNNPLNYFPVTSILNGQSGMTRKMVILFDGDVVHTYSLSSSEGKIKNGVLDDK